MKWLWILGALAGCFSTPPSSDIAGPFTGAPHRFVVDHLVLPADSEAARAQADDLDGDGQVDNHLGALIALLAGQHDAALHPDEMIASGVIGSVVIIQADDLANDPAVGVTYHGVEGDAATVMGGALVDGRLLSNRSRTTQVPGQATAILPVFADADPAVLAVDEMEVDLKSDGKGGFDAIVRGGVVSTAEATVVGVRQMLAANPAAHSAFARILDLNLDGMISDDEILDFGFIDGGFINALVEPDLPAHHLSVAFGVHLSPCASGTCAPVPPADLCFDRVRDGEETDVDCGGTSCRPCGPTFACKLAGDCETAACDAGKCRGASCSDGIENGFEEQIDCGGLCPGCIDDTCYSGADCRSGACERETSGMVCVQR